MEMKFLERFANYFVVFYFCVLSCLFYVYCMNNPINNWDILPYVAVAKSFEIKNLEDLRSSTFEEFRNFFPPRTYHSFIAANSYRKNFHQNLEVFKEQLVFYKIRFFYTFLIFVLYKMGLNIIKATYFLSTLSVIAGFWIIFLSFRQYISLSLWFIFPLFCFTTDTFTLARLSTPDGLAFLGISLSVYLFVKGYTRLLFFYLPFLVLIRTDLAIFSVLFSVFIFFNFRQRLPIISIFLTIFIYFVITNYFHYYGWKTIFYHTFIKRVFLPASESINFSFDCYFLRLKNIFLSLLKRPSLDTLLYTIYLLLSLSISVSFSLLFKKKVTKQIYYKIFILNLSGFFYCILHVLAFPVTWSRFFVAFYFLIILCLFFFLTEFEKFYKKNEKFLSNFEII